MARQVKTVAAALLAVASGGGGCAGILGIEDWEAQTGGAGAEAGSASSQSSSSAGGAAGDGGGGAAGGAGGVGGAPGELCQNSIDDDGDALVDCADATDCAAFACTPLAPSGWIGPVALAIDAPCDPTWSVAGPSGGIGLNVGASTCACACAAPTGQACDTAGVVAFASPGCGNDGVYAGYLPGNVCSNTPDVGAMSVLAGYLSVVGGSCAAVPMTTFPPPTFAKQATVCQAPSLGGAGCERGEVCAGKGACIYHTGLAACPAGQYTKQTVLYQSFSDTRGCTPCSCGPPQGSYCQGETFLYYDSGCTMTYGPIPNDYSCTSFWGVANLASFEVVPLSAPLAGACNASGSAATGSVTPIDPLTVCCAPPS